MLFESLIDFGRRRDQKDTRRVIVAKNMTIRFYIKSFGSKIKHHPHLHFLTSQGGVEKDGRFHLIQNPNL